MDDDSALLGSGFGGDSAVGRDLHPTCSQSLGDRLRLLGGNSQDIPGDTVFQLENFPLVSLHPLKFVGEIEIRTAWVLGFPIPRP